MLLPAYLCESVVTPVEAVGAQPVFFPVGAALRASIWRLSRRRSAPQTRAVVLIHYLGFPGPVEEVRALCERRGLALIEDCAHALYSRQGDRPLGSFGDLAIFSPWKSLPLPDGGLLRAEPCRTSMADAAASSARRRADAPRGWPTERSARVEQAVGWSPRLALLQRPGLRRSAARAGQRRARSRCWPARRSRGGCCAALGRRTSSGGGGATYARLLDACQRSHLGAARLRDAARTASARSGCRWWPRIATAGAIGCCGAASTCEPTGSSFRRSVDIASFP